MRISDWSSDVCSSDLGTQQRDAKERNENESPDQNRLVVRDRVQREAAEQRTGEMGCGFVHGLDPALFVMRARAWCRGLLFAAQLALAGVVRASHRTVVTGLRRMLEIAWHVLHDDVVIEAVGAMRVVMNRFARTRFGEQI